MTTPDGNSADMIYEQILDNARREIEDALAIIDELRQSIRQVEARVEAAQSIYNAVTARLNLEDELAEEKYTWTCRLLRHLKQHQNRRHHPSHPNWKNPQRRCLHLQNPWQKMRPKMTRAWI